MPKDDFEILIGAYEEHISVNKPAFWARWEGPEGVRELVAVKNRLGERGAGAASHALKFPNRLTLKPELYRRILQLRESGYRLAGGLDPDEVLKLPVRDLREDEEYGFIADDRGLETILRVKGDLRIAGDLDLEALYEEHADVLVVDGDLIVDGAITNLESDYGPVVYVNGRTVADALLVGGANLELGDTYLHLGYVRWYNHGYLDARTKGSSFAIDLEDDTLQYADTTLYDLAATAAALFHPYRELFDLSEVDLEAVRVFDAVRLNDPEWIEAQLDATDYWEEARLKEDAFLQLFNSGASRLCLLETFAAVWPRLREHAL